MFADRAVFVGFQNYVRIFQDPDFWQAFWQAKRLLGNRVELVLCETKDQQDAAVGAFDSEKSAAENAAAMCKAAGAK